MKSSRQFQLCICVGLLYINPSSRYGLNSIKYTQKNCPFSIWENVMRFFEKSYQNKCGGDKNSFKTNNLMNFKYILKITITLFFFCLVTGRKILNLRKHRIIISRAYKVTTTTIDKYITAFQGCTVLRDGKIRIRRIQFHQPRAYFYFLSINCVNIDIGLNNARNDGINFKSIMN